MVVSETLASLTSQYICCLEKLFLFEMIVLKLLPLAYRFGY